MDSLTIILIVVSSVLFAILLWVLIRNGKKPDISQELTDLNTLLSKKEREISTLQRNLESETKMSEETIAQLKDSNSRLKEENIKKLEEAASKIKELEGEISKAISEGTDEIVRKKLGEADKLFKKVKNLEDELEESQDEIDDLTKKNKKLKAENNSLNESVENEIRKGKRLLEEINEVKGRLEEVEKEFALREEALDFVKEILTAKRTSDTSVQNLYQTVDGIVDYIKGDVRDCLKSINALTSEHQQEFFGHDLGSWALSKKKSWIQGKTTIAFVGEFSAGKTSIVNRILSQDNPDVPLLPVSTKATTAIPTYISGGVSTYYQFVTPDNELKMISEDTFKRVNKEILDQVKGISSLIQYFVMTYRNANLDRLSILDTPGFNSNDSEDAERTVGVINECDALFWVFDVNAGTVNRSSIETIKKHLTKPLYVVINQIDTKSKSDVDSVEQLIRKTLGEAGVEINGVIRFSKKEPLDRIMTPILSIPHDNSKEVYLENLMARLDNIGKELSKKTKAAHKNSNVLEEQSQNLVDAYNDAIDILIDDCETARKIPQYHERTFRKDDYRLSQEQYTVLKGILDQIRDSHTETLLNLYHEQMDTVSELESSWKEYSDARFNQKRFEECLQTLRNRSRKLSNIINAGSRNTNQFSNQLKKNDKEGSYEDYTGRYDSQNMFQQPNYETYTSLGDYELSITEFLSYFKNCITEQNGDNVKVDWYLLTQQISNVLDKNVSGNKMRKIYPLFGVNDWISLEELSEAVMNFINK